MLIILPMGAKRRGKKLRGSDTPPAPEPLNVIGVEDVVQEEGTLALTVVFDTTAENPLVGIEQASAGKWAAHFAENRYLGDGLQQIAFDRVRVSFIYDDYQPGAPTDVAYAADPSDIADAAGRKLAAMVYQFDPPV